MVVMYISVINQRICKRGIKYLIIRAPGESVWWRYLNRSEPALTPAMLFGIKCHSLERLEDLPESRDITHWQIENVPSLLKT